jgi:hypothetical protein
MGENALRRQPMTHAGIGELQRITEQANAE